MIFFRKCSNLGFSENVQSRKKFKFKEGKKKERTNEKGKKKHTGPAQHPAWRCAVSVYGLPR
jgi:hypothetical protein